MSEISLQADHPTDTLPDYVRGRAADADEIERHLAGCEQCRLELEILRALADRSFPGLSEAEREGAFAGVSPPAPSPAGGGPAHGGPALAASGGWLSVAWKVAAAIALLLTGVGVWQVVRVGGEAGAGWDPQFAIDAWEVDLAALEPAPGEIRLALGIGLLDEPMGVSWDDLEGVDPTELAVPWEEDR